MICGNLTSFRAVFQVLNFDLNQFSNLLLMMFNTGATSKHHVNGMFFNE
ncbi:hypothetical protein CIT292_08082 [Citrobacter youngae ATCC 29220]|uniref:Uncharacterized protein n=1 Tax=Citrobacter youngae ATCC 29220 TaxID=500640 RepID=D4BC76_9ENTR|nr:hypothetical protein CIT292_08082 [Citrobacter youngae ATCC 29220]